MNPLRTMSDMISRGALAAFLGRSHGGARDLYDQFGYPKVIQPRELMAMYLRNGIANRIVRSFPSATWRDSPIIRDAAGESGEEGDKGYSPFVASVNSIFERHRVLHYLARADRLSGVGRYGVIVLGFQDGKHPHEPLEKGNHPLMYIQAYSETNTTINTYEVDKRSPRYGRPKQYTVKTGSLMGDKSSQTTSLPVHWTRVIHLAEFLDEDDVYGTPRLMPAFNHLMDLEKVLGSGAETFWLNARPGLGLFAESDANFSDEALADMKKQATAYDHQLQRILAMQGVTAQQFNASIADPKPNIDTLLDVISGTVGIPKRILVGSERGELSSTQDETNWSNKIDERREHFVSPSILVPFIQKMIETGNIIRPEKKFWVEWPEIGALGAKEEADVGLVRTQMLSAYVSSPGSDLLVPPTEFRTLFLGLEPQSEYQDEVNEFPELDETLPPDESEPPLSDNLLVHYDESQPREKDGKFGETSGGDDGGGDDYSRSDPGLADEDDSRPAHNRIAGASLSSPPTSKEYGAVEFYTGDGYIEINNDLRKMGRTSFSEVKDLDTLFSKTSLSEPIVAYRSMSERSLKRITEAGGTFTDAGFVSLSASADYDFQGTNITVEVRLPKGSKALPVAGMSVNSSENEILVNRGSSFKVVKQGSKTILELQKEK